jgi:hypothetical protein
MTFYKLTTVIIFKPKCLSCARQLRVVGHITRVVMIGRFKSKGIYIEQVVKYLNCLVSTVINIFYSAIDYILEHIR